MVQEVVGGRLAEDRHRSHQGRPLDDDDGDEDGDDDGDDDGDHIKVDQLMMMMITSMQWREADGKSLLKIHSSFTLLICAKEIKCLSPEDNSEHVMKVSTVNLEGTIFPNQLNPAILFWKCPENLVIVE